MEKILFKSYLKSGDSCCGQIIILLRKIENQER